jgi:hypothetical protein
MNTVIKRMVFVDFPLGQFLAQSILAPFVLLKARIYRTFQRLKNIMFLESHLLECNSVLPSQAGDNYGGIFGAPRYANAIVSKCDGWMIPPMITLRNGRGFCFAHGHSLVTGKHRISCGSLERYSHNR